MSAGTVAAWRRLAGAWGVALLAAAGAAFLVSRPHDDRLSGLDSMCYGATAEAVAKGRVWVGEDDVWAQVPPGARPGLVFGRGARLTRDWAWELAPEAGREALTRPYFPPGPAWLGAWLVRAGAGSERTVPLLGAIWWCCLLWAGWKRGGWAGVVASAALAAATPWPAWFLRGWHAEAAGAAVVGCVWLLAAGEGGGEGWWRRGAFPAVAGFLLGGSLCLHPTMLLLAGPAALALGLHWAWSGSGRGAGWLWGGTAAGAGLLWWTTRAVAHPYGDWTRWAWWHRMFAVGTIPEHGAMAAGLAGLAFLGAAAGLAAWHPTWRRRGMTVVGEIPGWTWVAAGAAPAVVAVLHGPVGLPVLAAAALPALWAGRGRDRAMLLAVLWTGLLFAVIQGAERPTGLWGLRRMLPPVLMGVAVAGPAVGAWVRRWGRRRGALASAALAAVCAWGPARGGWVWAARNGEGSAVAVEALRRWMDGKEADAAARGAEKPWFVFGEFHTGQGALASGGHLAVALGGAGRADPEGVFAWVRELAASGREVWWVSGLEAARLEEGGVLEGPETIWNGAIRTVNSKRFLPAQWREKEIHWKAWRWRVPGDGGGCAEQEVAPAGAVLGIRGAWGRERKGGRWTREGSGVVGPAGAGGGRVQVTVEGAWPGGEGTAEVQKLLVEGPWGGKARALRFPSKDGWVERSVVLRVPEGVVPGEGTGVYRFRAEHPWNPGESGLRGYEEDLGILARRVSIRCLP